MDRHLQSVLESSRRMQEVQEGIYQAQFERDNPVIAAFEALGEYIKDFEAGLDDDHEVGARLVTFGQSIQIHVQSVGYAAPFLITFEGVDSDGRKLRLIQHVTQLNFLLIALKKLEDKPYRIGFIWEGQDK